jgi:hypothetical protein
MNTPVRFCRNLWLGGIALGMAFAQPARPAPTPKFYGFARGLRFECGASGAVQRAILHLPSTGGEGSLDPGWTAPVDPEHKYGLEPVVSPGPGDGQDIKGRWGMSNVNRPIAVVVDPERAQLLGFSTFRQRALIALLGEGTMEHYDERSATNPVASCSASWKFLGYRRAGPPPGPRSPVWIRRQFNLIEIELQAEQTGTASPIREATATAPATPPLWVALTPCAKQTACFGAPGSSRVDLLVRTLPLSDGRLGPAYLPLTTAGVDIWSRQVGEGNDAARAWFIPAATAALDRPGFLDLLGYTAANPATAPSERWEESEALLQEFDPDLTNTVSEAGPPPPSSNWLTTPNIPGFRFQARLAGAPLLKANACPAQTICFAKTAPGVPEIVARILPKQANGKRWPVVAKFASPAAGVWVEQTSTHQVRYYELQARAADSPELPGVVDRVGFAP